jgi:hypothetical protein
MTEPRQHPLAQIARECGLTVTDVRKALIAESYEHFNAVKRVMSRAIKTNKLTDAEADLSDAHNTASAYAYLLAALLRIIEDRHGEDEALGMACMVDAVRESGTDVLEDANRDLDGRPTPTATEALEDANDDLPEPVAAEAVAQ